MSVTNSTTNKEVEHLKDEIRLLGEVIESQDVALQAKTTLVTKGRLRRIELIGEVEEKQQQISGKDDELERINTKCERAEKQLQDTQEKADGVQRQLEEAEAKMKDTKRKLGLNENSTDKELVDRIEALGKAATFVKDVKARLKLSLNLTHKQVLDVLAKNANMQWEFNELKKLLNIDRDVASGYLKTRIEELQYYKDNEPKLKSEIEKYKKLKKDKENLLIAARREKDRLLELYEELDQYADKTYQDQKQKLPKPKKQHMKQDPRGPRGEGGGASMFMQLQSEIKQLTSENGRIKLENEKLKAGGQVDNVESD